MSKIRKPLNNPYKVVQMFEEEVAIYTGAPYAISVDSCTNALFLCLQYLKQKTPHLSKSQYLAKLTYQFPNQLSMQGLNLFLIVI